MKENSIEEDIEIIESIIEEYENCSVPEVDMQVNVTFREKQNNALNHILSDYKRVLKENEELKNQEATARKINELLVERYSNSISVQKVKDKMQKDIKANESITFGGKRNGKTLEYGKRLGRIEMCQELLEGRK